MMEIVHSSVYYYYPNRLCLSDTFMSMLPPLDGFFFSGFSPEANLPVDVRDSDDLLRSPFVPCPVTVTAPRMPPVPRCRPLCSLFQAASCSLFQLPDSFGS